MNRLVQGVRRPRRQQLLHGPEMVLPDLHPKCHARRTEKQKIPEKPVIIKARQKSPVREIIFDDPTGIHVLEHCDIDPRRVL